MLLPLPETPVIIDRQPNGIFKLTFFKLFSLAPLTLIKYFDFFLLFEYSILSTLFKYCDVNESPFVMLFKFPLATISPPNEPAFGPISII